MSGHISLSTWIGRSMTWKDELVAIVCENYCIRDLFGCLSYLKMPPAQRIPTRQEPVYCCSCRLISNSGANVEWYTWASPMSEEVFCSDCLCDPGQHWGEELYLLRLASFGSGSPESIYPLLDRIGGRREGMADDWGSQTADTNISEPVAFSCDQTYQYQRLHTQMDHIRVLRLVPGTGSSPILCSLEIVAFDRRYSDFTAVSYSWGDLKAQKVDIYVEDSNHNWASFKVLRNLHEFLLEMRHPQQSRRLWIDAICIDQGKNIEATTERDAQLDLMGRIYRQASSVVIWLGVEEDNSDEVIKVIRERDIIQMRTSKFWKGIAKVLQRSWFERTWVIQELALNEKPPQLLCGHQQVSWTRFMAAYSFTIITQELELRDGPNIAARSYLTKSIEKPNLHNMATIRTQVKIDGGSMIERPLYRLLLLSRRFKATKAEDRVYGLRGLVLERLLSELPVNSTFSIDRVYQNAVQFMLTHEEGAQLFAQFALPLSLDKDKSLWPSWVPDFNSTSAALQTIDGDADWYYHYPFRPHDFEIPMRGDRHHLQGVKPTVHARFLDRKLIVKGVRVDLIDALVPSKINQGIDYSAVERHGEITNEITSVETESQAQQELVNNLSTVLQRAGGLIYSSEERSARSMFLSTLSLEERTLIRVKEYLKRAKVLEITIDRLKTSNTEVHLPIINDYFDNLKATIKSQLPDEDKEACLSMLDRIMEQETPWDSPTRTLPNHEIAALVERVRTLSRIPIHPGPEIIDFADKFIDLSAQAILLQDHMQIIANRMNGLVSQLKDAKSDMQSHITSVVESTAAVDRVYKTLLQNPSPTWSTDIWHVLLDGYHNLKDLSPQTFRQGFLDLVGSDVPPAGTLDWEFEAPRSDQPLSKHVSKALRNVYHEGTQFFICKATGTFGIGTSAAAKDDLVVLLFPTWHIPMVLRPVKGSGEREFLMVGPAILPSAQRMALLKKYETLGHLQNTKLDSFTIT